MKFKPAHIVLGVATGILLLVAIILLAVSFSVLDPTEVGLQYNKNTQRINRDKLFQGGRHFLGVGHTFIRYPTNLQTIKFQDNSDDADSVALTARTNDGLQLHMELSFTFKLKDTVEDILELYDDFEEDFRSAFVRVSRDVLRTAASNFKASQYFFERLEVNVQMQAALSAELDRRHALVEQLAIENIELPSKFREAIQETQRQQQLVEQTKFEQESTVISAETALLRAVSEASILIVDAEARATNFRVTKEAQADSILAVLESQEAAFATLKTQLGLDSPELLNYLFTKAIEESPSTSMVLDMPRPPTST